MKVILLEDVPALGHRGDVQEVAPGYGRNYLIPQRLAILATPSNLKNIEQIRKRQEARAEKDRVSAEAQAQAIEALAISLTRQASEDGRLYGSVSAQDIATLLTQHGINVERRRIGLEAPIKALGEHTVPVWLHAEVIVQLKISVGRE